MNFTFHSITFNYHIRLLFSMNLSSQINMIIIQHELKSSSKSRYCYVNLCLYQDGGKASLILKGTNTQSRINQDSDKILSNVYERFYTSVIVNCILWSQNSISIIPVVHTYNEGCVHYILRQSLFTLFAVSCNTIQYCVKVCFLFTVHCWKQ